MNGADLRVRERVAWVSLRRGRTDDDAAAGALASAVEELRFREDVSVVVLTARGDHFFFTADAATPAVAGAVAAVAALAQPVLGVLGSRATGDGAALALACDLRIAARGSSIQFPQMLSGRLPGCGATQRLPRLIGRTRALEVMLSGRRVGSAEAARIGLLNGVETAARLPAAARRLAANLAARGPLALRFAKEAVLQGLDLTLAQGIRLEQDLYVLLQTTDDRAEGVRAFLRRRAPRYRGR